MNRDELRENMMVAVDTLRANKGRSALTILGIVIGVTSVIAVAAIITGLNRFVQQRVERLGSRTFFLARMNMAARFGKVPEAIRRRKYFDYSDADYLKSTCPSLESVSPFNTRAFFLGQSNDIRYGSERVDRIFLRGAGPEYADALEMFQAEIGRFISRYDEDHARQVVVIGRAIADSLFPSSDPLGKTVRLNGKLYEVIGVMARDEGTFGAGGVDQFAIIPLSDFKKHYPESKELAIGFTVARDVPPEKGMNEVVEAMRRRRKVSALAENDFEVFSPDFLSQLWEQLTGALVILTGVISSVGLLVGGIGVMNIMLISVTERTGEIGIRKAIGARKSDIRVQFLLEAVMLTSVGGAIGILLGGLIAFLVRSFVPSIPASLSLLWILLGVGISVSVGLFFGYYPANRAAELDPIVCLRYE
jgi:putative ABC transport system permease protein